MKKREYMIFCGILFVICSILSWYLYAEKKLLKNANEKAAKFKKYYQVYNKWIQNLQNKVSVEGMLEKKNIKRIAIYGNGEIGNRLYEELKGTGVKVCYFVDKMMSDIPLENDEGIKIHGVNQLNQCENVDIIIVTPIHQYEEIRDKILEQNSKFKVVSIEDIVF